MCSHVRQFESDASAILRDVLDQLIGEKPKQERSFEDAFRDRHSHEVGGATSESKLQVPAKLVDRDMQPEMVKVFLRQAHELEV